VPPRIRSTSSPGWGTHRRHRSDAGRDRIRPRDAIHVAVMLNHDIDRVATFDEGFDRIKGITRVTIQ
jgi:predicted nucleic acid-binding protein